MKTNDTPFVSNFMKKEVELCVFRSYHIVSFSGGWCSANTDKEVSGFLKGCDTAVWNRTVPAWKYNSCCISGPQFNQMYRTMRCETTHQSVWCRYKSLTDGVHKVVEGAVCEERLRKLPEEHLESAGRDVDVLPLTVVQVHLLIWHKETINKPLIPGRFSTACTRGPVEPHQALPWFTAKRSFWITARFPLTLYRPSTLRPAQVGERAKCGSWWTYSKTDLLFVLKLRNGKLLHPGAFCVKSTDCSNQSNKFWKRGLWNMDFQRHLNLSSICSLRTPLDVILEQQSSAFNTIEQKLKENPKLESI